MPESAGIKKGDRVMCDEHRRGRVMLVVSDPIPFNGLMVVTCQWPKWRSKKYVEQGLFSVKILKRVDAE